MARCDQCGFLALRSSQSHELDIADEQFRQQGYINQQRHYALPICAMGVVNFRDEMNPGREEMALAAIQKNRSCTEMMRWHPSLTPKEHADMRIAEQSRAESERRNTEMREWQERREEQSKRDRADEKKSDREWQETQATKSFRRTLLAGAISTVFGAILTLAIGKLNPPAPPTQTTSPQPSVATPQAPADAPVKK
jgi:hypothetical protein